MEPAALSAVNAFAGFFFAFVVFAFYVLVVALVYFLPKPNSEGRTLSSLTNLVSLIFLWLVSAASSALSNIAQNWRWWLLTLVVVVGTHALYAKQPEADKAEDAYQTSALYPVLNVVVFPILNTIRMLFNAVICFTNILANFTRIITNQFFDITFTCSTMDWSAFPEALRDFAISSVNGVVSWIRSGFTTDLKIAPMLKALADLVSALNPLIDCQCNDLNFLWPVLINPNYGVIQSKHLHLLPEAVVNLKFAGYRTLAAGGIGIAQRILVGCNGSRDCEVAREPKFDDMSRLQCNTFTHATDFLDDWLYSIDSMLADKLNLIVPWNSTPRPFGMWAMPLCAGFDFLYLGADAVFHFDLFWRLSPYSAEGNYAAELRFDTIFSRLYNFTDQLEQLGVDIGGDFAEPVFCVLGRTLRILVALIDYVVTLVQYLLAYAFVNDPLGQYAASAHVQNITAMINEDAEQIKLCAQDLNDEFGHGGKYFVIGITMTVDPLIKIVNGFIENSGTGGDVLSYLGSFDFRDNIVKTFEGLYVIVGSIGGTIRSTGAFGSTTCSVRDLADDPRNLEKIEMGSMNLNIMCAIGTTVEMFLRYPLVVVDYVVGIIAAICEIVVGIVSGPVTVSTFAVPFQDGGAFDLGKDNGILETQCLLMDSISLIPPSLLTLGPSLTCPSSVGVLVAQPIYDVIRSAARTVGMAPFWFARAIGQTFGKFFCGGSSCLDFGSWCDAFLLPLWKSSISPPVQIVVSVFDLIGCLTPGGGLDSTLSSIGVALGKAFIDTDYGTVDIVVDCTDLVGNTDGGLVIEFLCGFFETLSVLVDLILTIFEKGFWQAIWEWISGALKAVLDLLKKSIECVFGVVVAMFNKLGDCLYALIRVDRFFPNPKNYLDEVKAECGNWGGVFTGCSISFKLPEFGINSPLPEPGYGTSGGTINAVISRPGGEMLGVCILPDQTTCSSRYDAVEDHDGKTCANLATPQSGAKRLVLGRTCKEALNVSFDPFDATLGACCIPDVGCAETSYLACNNTGVLWVENEVCSSLDSTCRVTDSIYTTQFGCCVTDDGVNPFSGDLRVAKSYMNAYDCYKSTSDLLNLRAYFIADDPTCSNVDPALLTESNAYLDNATTGGALPYSRAPCTPEYELYKRQASSEVDAACIMQNGPVGTSDVINGLTERTKIAGTGFEDDNDIGKWWFCHNTSVQQRNSFAVGINPTPFCFSKNGGDCAILTRRKLYNWGNQIQSFVDRTEFFGFVLFEEDTTRFADVNAMTGRSLTQRAALFDEAFITECRFVWIIADGCSVIDPVCDWRVATSAWSSQISIADPIARGDGTLANNPVNYPPGMTFNILFTKYVGADCRIQKKTSLGIPRFDEGIAYDIPAVDAHMSELDDMTGLVTDIFDRPTMTILYGINTTFDLTRDNTNGRCNTFRYPDYPPPAPVTTGTTGTTGGGTTGSATTGTTGGVMAPMMVENAPVYGSESDSTALSTGAGRRRLLFFEGIDLFDYDKQAMNESHPCFMIFFHLQRAQNESDGLVFLLHERFQLCIFSNAVSYAIEAMLMWDSTAEGTRLVSPYVLYSPIVGASTAWNASRGIWNGFGYVGYYYQSYIKMKVENTSSENFAISWNQYASFNGVTDGLGYRIGSFISIFGQMLAAFDWQKIVAPGGTGIFSFILGTAKWSDLRSQNYTFPERINMTQYEAPVVSDSGWEWFNAWFNWTSSTNSEGITEGGANLTLALEYNRKLTNLKNFMYTRGGDPALLTGDEIMLSATGSPCDPTDRSCVDCEIVVSTIEVLVEVVENCIEDLQNTKRFNLDPTKVDLTRNNTFIQDGDILGCTDPEPLEETFLLTAVLDFIDLFAPENRSRYWVSRLACYATNWDLDDLHSTLFYGRKIFQCDPINDGSAHRGRAGIGLLNAILVVGGIYLGLIILSAWFLPVIPTNWISILIVYLAINLLAYWSSPMCFFGSPLAPIPVIVDAIFDDSYVLLREAVPTNCSSYHPDITTSECNDLGRDFIDCKDYGFDATGARHMAYILEAITPGFTQTLLETSVPIASSIFGTEYYQTAFKDISSVYGTPIGEFCTGLKPYNVRRFAPTFGGVTQLTSFALLFVSLLSVLFILFAIAVVVLAFLVNFSAYVTVSLTRWDVKGKRYIVTE